MAEENKEIVVIDETTMKSKIYYVRSQKVMLDFIDPDTYKHFLILRTLKFNIMLTSKTA